MLLNKALLKIIIQIIEKTPHEILRGVCLDYDEKKIVATNGHIQLVIDAPELEGIGRIVVPCSALTAIFKLADKKTPITFTSSTVKAGPFEVPYTPMTFVDIRVPGKPTEGTKYPDWKSVVPPDKKESDPGLFGFYNSKYIAMAEQLKTVFGEVPIFHLPSRWGGVLKIVYGDKAIALLAPVRVETANKYYGESE